MFLNILDTTDPHDLPIRVLRFADTPIALWTPVRAYTAHRFPFDPRAEYTLSRYACLRRAGDQVVVELPGCPVRIDLIDGRAVALFGQLLGGLPVDPVFREFFVSAGFMQPDGTPYLAFHDALFQWQTRMGVANLLSPPPALEQIAPLTKLPMSDERIPLYQPDLDALARTDLPFSAVLEARRTHYDYDARHPITIEQLGEFLYRSARVQRVIRGDFYDGSQRPSPGAGALHPLELYVAAAACAGLEPDLYHYDALAHQLERLRHPITPLVSSAARMTGGQVSAPQVLIVITARFDRVYAKYPQAALSLVLKDVGALYQTMYLVATALGLSPCALGGGDAALLWALLGDSEQSVGEFLIGSRIRSS